ncbi:MAG: C-3',4' desaturase CrtD [Cyanobacteriota bacterium]|nr:C-3',4' desaturase CrtD [Cyanobacteriota bacterium]
MTEVLVVGAGMAGLTAAALLARKGRAVVLLEAHHQSGGCAGTFRRGPYVFDVGATQVAGLEPGGIHARLFADLGVEPPAATPLDPGCVVDLADGSPPVALWRDPLGWHQERERQFPGSGAFWTLCDRLQRATWAFADRDPVLPPRSWWDLGQLVGALDPAVIGTGVFATCTVADLLGLTGAARGEGGRRLRRFLDLQLQLYSQEPSDRTAALYGATVLSVVQEPRGLWHLHGSMQALSTALERGLAAAGGDLRLRHRVQRLRPPHGRQDPWTVEGVGPGGVPFAFQARDVVLTLPPQTLPGLLADDLPNGYRRRLEGLHEPSGALVFYGALERRRLPVGVASHLQLDWPDPGPLFVSVSQERDGRAPEGEATVIASVFTRARLWFGLEEKDYQGRKREAMDGIQAGLARLLGVEAGHWRHAELATPRGWEGWTGRPWGYVGGLGQHPSGFGPFGLASRTPLRGLWLCGDSLHPGEGTAGVSTSAAMVCRQVLQQGGSTV